MVLSVLNLVSDFVKCYHPILLLLSKGHGDWYRERRVALLPDLHPARESRQRLSVGGSHTQGMNGIHQNARKY
jgi:hypothetical protein